MVLYWLVCNLFLYLNKFAVKIFYLVSNYAKVLVSNKSPFMLSDLSVMNFFNLNLQKVVVRQTRLVGKFCLAKFITFRHRISFHSFHTRMFEEQLGEKSISLLSWLAKNFSNKKDMSNCAIMAGLYFFPYFFTFCVCACVCVQS